MSTGLAVGGVLTPLSILMKNTSARKVVTQIDDENKFMFKAKNRLI